MGLVLVLLAAPGPCPSDMLCLPAVLLYPLLHLAPPGVRPHSNKGMTLRLRNAHRQWLDDATTNGPMFVSTAALSQQINLTPPQPAAHIHHDPPRFGAHAPAHRSVQQAHQAATQHQQQPVPARR